MNLLRCAGLAALLAVSGTAVAAQNPPPPIYATSTPTVEEVIEENTYYYKLMRYEPAVPVATVDPKAAPLDSPEASVIASIAAMRAGDFAAFRGTWTDEARAMMEARDREQARGPEVWLDAWRRTFAGGRTVELTHRVDTGRFVLIGYRVVPADGEQDVEPIELVTPVEQVGERWLATQALSGDPVLAYWRTPGHRVKKMVRGITAQ